jgi:two-component system nitrogen regulation sensor histidine kinase NtrY
VESQDAAIVTVTDNGIGLPVESRERLTEPYVTTRARGTGLGLAIVKKIVEDHGGTLELGDAPGGGAFARACLSRGMVADYSDTDLRPPFKMTA